MVEFIKNILKGMVVGIANIIPGVSGGTLMVSMNIYDKLIESITHFFSKFKQAMAFLIPLFLGIGIAIIASSFGIEAMFKNFPIQANLLFIGLILGGLPVALKGVKQHKMNIPYGICFLAFFLLVVGLAAMGGDSGVEKQLSTSLVGLVVLFFIGVITSATMVIPGVSGSMILVLLGYYNPVLSAVTDFIRSLKAMDIEGIIFGFKILVPFGLGVVFGIFAIAKLIEIIFKKFPYHARWAIIGLIVSSPVAIVLLNDFSGINLVSIGTGLIAFLLGLIISIKLGE